MILMSFLLILIIKKKEFKIMLIIKKKININIIKEILYLKKINYIWKIYQDYQQIQKLLNI